MKIQIKTLFIKILLSLISFAELGLSLLFYIVSPLGRGVNPFNTPEEGERLYIHTIILLIASVLFLIVTLLNFKFGKIFSKILLVKLILYASYVVYVFTGVLSHPIPLEPVLLVISYCALNIILIIFNYALHHKIKLTIFNKI
jgi:hypothetical protein